MSPLIKKAATSVVQRRPAETAGALFATGGLGWGIATGNVQAIVTAIVGYVPAVWTFLAVNGGVSGVLRTIWRGRNNGR